MCLWKSKEASVAGGDKIMEREAGEEAEVRLWGQAGYTDSLGFYSQWYKAMGSL